jgi:hypothetical protein
MLACNVFRTHTRDLYCAVPEDQPVPPFVGGTRWEFVGRLAELSAVRPSKAMTAAIRFNGFYIFHPRNKQKHMS